MEDKLSREEIFAEAKRIVPLVYDEKDLIKFDIDNYKKYIDKKYKLFSIDIELLLVGLCGMKYDGEDWLNDKIDMKKSIKHHQEVLDYDKKEFGANVEGRYTTYTGYLKCNECNCNLRKFTRPNSNNNFYYCNTYVKNKNCSKHYITEKEVDDIVLNVLNTHIDMMCDLEKELNERVSVSSVEYKKEISKIRLVEINKEIDKYEKLLKEIINDYEKDYISKNDFDSFNKEYIYNLNNLRIEKEEIEKKKISGLDLKWLNEYKRIGRLKNIDRNIISKFINNIYIDENKNIRIEFKYKDQYEDAIKYLKSQNNMV